jgi:hypothetical protein
VLDAIQGQHYRVSCAAAAAAGVQQDLRCLLHCSSCNYSMQGHLPW